MILKNLQDYKIEQSQIVTETDDTPSTIKKMQTQFSLQ